MQHVKAAISQLGNLNVETLFVRKRGPGPKRTVYVNQPLPESFRHPKKPHKVKKEHVYQTNQVLTSKYSIITFLPRNLLEQFRRIANVFFLGIAILQFFPKFSTISPGLVIFPLLIVLGITALKDGYEDIKRHQSDRRVNDTLVLSLSGGGFVNENVMASKSRSILDDLVNMVVRFFKELRKSRKGVEDDSESDDGVTTEFDDEETPRHSISSHPGVHFRRASSIIRGAVPHHPRPHWAPVRWEDVSVGSFIKLKSDEPIPADILICATSEDEDVCFIETKNLDGETNLKSRNACPGLTKLRTAKRCVDGPVEGSSSWWVDCERPEVDMYRLNATVTIPLRHSGAHPVPRRSASSYHRRSLSSNRPEPPRTDIQQYPVDIQNVLLRGTVLRNTKWVIGVVLFTGEDTKIVLNSGGTPSKRSKVERQMNPQVFINLILLAFMAVACAIVDSVNEHEDQPAGAPWLYGSVTSDDNPSINGLVTWAYSLITFQNIVPISLYISIEFVRTAQAAFIYFDSEIYYPKTDTPTLARSWNLSDDLGQIEYIFSDKTGTLTQNSMLFQKCSIGGVVYHGDPENVEEKDMSSGEAQELKDTSPSSAQMNEKSPTDPENRPSPEKPRHRFHDTQLAAAMEAAVDSQSDPNHARALHGFFTVLSLCHTVLTAVDPDTGGILYKAQSPDESALVQAAADVGYVFKGRDGEVLTLQTPSSASPHGRQYFRDKDPTTSPSGSQELEDDGLERYELLNILDFTSSRKRMSVIVRRLDGDDDRIFLLVKGADNVIFERLKAGSQDELKKATEEHLDEFASYGLRTLTLAFKIVPEQEYIAWNERYQEATLSLEGREAKIEAVSAEIEQDIRLLGATAIEDKLQDGVPETIADLKRAGIKIWVLTGDKLETAIAIGHSTNLIGREANIIIVRGSNDTNKLSVYEQMAHAAERFFPESSILEGLAAVPRASTSDGLHRVTTGASLVGAGNGDRPGGFVLVIDGAALATALNDETHKSLLLKLALECEGVICCRVSPLQKALVTRLVKDGLKTMTLAIGDGANDVSMIQAADVGVGISGEEGLQAVNSSDYAIAQFRFLKRLLLVHGHWSYARNGNMIVNFFYKNIVCIGVLWWFQIYASWSSAYAFEYTYLLWWNAFFTIFPVIAIGLFDRVADAEVMMALPELYRHGREGEWYNMTKFFWYMFDAVVQSVIIYFFINYTYVTTAARSDGWSPYQYEFTTTMAVAAVMAANLYNGLNCYTWTWWTFFAIAEGIVLVWGYTVIYSLISPGWFHVPVYGNYLFLFTSAYFWLCLPLVICLALLPRYIVKVYKFGWNPHDFDIMRYICHTEPHRDLTVEAQPGNALRALRRPSEERSPSPSSQHSRGSVASPPQRQPDIPSTDMATGLRTVHRGFSFSTEEHGVELRRMQSNLSRTSVPGARRTRARRKSLSLSNVLSIRLRRRPDISENE